MDKHTFENCHNLTCRRKQYEAYKIDICREFAHELKEAFNNDFPSNYPSTKPFFTLEGVRALVDLVLKEQGNERE